MRLRLLWLSVVQAGSCRSHLNPSFSLLNLLHDFWRPQVHILQLPGHGHF